MYKQRLPAVWGSCAYFLEMDLRRRRVRPTTFWTPSHRLGVLGLHCITAVISLITLGVSLGFFSHQSPQLEMPSESVTRWVCMGCHQPNQHGGPTSYFADYKAAACHYARAAQCNKSMRGLRTVTIVSRPSDRDAGGGGAVGPWPPVRPQPGEYYITYHITVI